MCKNVKITHPEFDALSYTVFSIQSLKLYVEFLSVKGGGC